MWLEVCGNGFVSGLVGMLVWGFGGETGWLLVVVLWLFGYGALACCVVG